MKKVNIAIFVSGSGSNCENLIRYFEGSERIATPLVVSNKPDAYALVRAYELGVPAAVVSKTELNNPEVMLPLLNKYDIHFIVLAGFLPLIPNFLIEAFPRKIVNLHPALLPETGMTVHYVTPVCDGGEIIAQYKCELSPEDSVDDIAAKEHELEMRYFPQIVEKTIFSEKS